MFKIEFSLFMLGIRWELTCFLCTDTVQSTIGSFSFLCIWKTRDILWKTLPVETETLLILQKTQVHKNWLNWLPVFFNRQLEGWGGKKVQKKLLTVNQFASIRKCSCTFTFQAVKIEVIANDISKCFFFSYPLQAHKKWCFVFPAAEVGSK